MSLNPRMVGLCFQSIGCIALAKLLFVLIPEWWGFVFNSTK